MFDSFDALIEANNRSIKALNQCLARLSKFTIGASLQEFARLQAQIGRVTAQINLLNVINAHLEAANVPFKPLDGDTLESLRQAFDRVDRAIIKNEIIGATIDTINDVFAAAAKIGDITNGAA